MVGVGRFGLGGDANGGLGGGTGRGVGGCCQGIDRDRRLIRWEDNVANTILGGESNDTLAYAPGLEIHHPIISMIRGHGGQFVPGYRWNLLPPGTTTHAVHARQSKD